MQLYCIVETVVNTYAPLKAVNRKVLNRFERFTIYLLFILEMSYFRSLAIYGMIFFTDVRRPTKRQFKYIAYIAVYVWVWGRVIFQKLVKYCKESKRNNLKIKLPCLLR